MTKDNKQKFNEITKYIEEKKFEEATIALKKYIKSEDEEITSYSYYLLGYINTCWENKNKSDDHARRYLLYNINSKYPHYYAYVLYADVEEDKNIVERCLEQGLGKFPKQPKIYEKLLRYSLEKEKIISRILADGISDFDLLCKVIEVLIKLGKWGKISRLIFRIKQNYDLDELTENYLNLLNGYGELFKAIPNYEKAIKILEEVASRDINNHFGYAHYIGIIYAYTKIGIQEKANCFFDKLPDNDSIFDLFDGPMYFITVEFDKEYKNIFETLQKIYKRDDCRCCKAKALYALYLYNPSQSYEIYRYTQKDIDNLLQYFNSHYNKHIACALFNMNCHLKNYVMASEAFLKATVEGDDFDEFCALYSEITDKVNIDELESVVNNVIKTIKECEYLDEKLFISNIADVLVKKLHYEKKYDDVLRLADLLTINNIAKSENAFFYAYAYSEIDSPNGLKIYEKILEREPDNSAVLNNIGVIYEHKGELNKALQYFEKANIILNDELHENNIKRVYNKINEIEKNRRKDKQKEYRKELTKVNIDFFEKIGYNDDFISKIELIKQQEIKNILKRDIKECAFAIAIGQNKSATILIGSAIEAIIYSTLKNRGIKAYEILRKGNRVKVKVDEMSLNELLSVLEQEQLIDINSFHLSHYVRDYRNFAHPAKEIRSKEKITGENVLIMWSVLKRLVDVLL